MAKTKTWAVEVEYVVKETLFIDARSQSTAEEKALTDEAWREAHMYDDDAYGGCKYFPPSNERKVIKSRIV